jgi:hypothetical protein
LTLLAFLVLPASLHAKSDDFANSALGKELINLGLKFLDNPGDFFFNLHNDNEDFSPVPDDRHGAVRFNFFPTFLPVTWGNLNFKIKVLNDRGSQPQVDLVGMYGDLLALRAIPAGDGDQDIKPVFNDYAFGAVVSKAVDAKTRLFGGVKFSNVNMEVNFSSPVAAGDFEMSSLDFKISDTFFMTGITHQSSPETLVVAQMGYGFKYKKFFSRIMSSHRHVEFGMDIYPEGLFVIHPFIAWHWYF